MMSLSHVLHFSEMRKSVPRRWKSLQFTTVFVPLFFPFSKYIFAVNQMFYGDNSSPSQLA